MNIYDIAREAGVSISTVSRVLNDKNVSAENAEKIKRAMEKLGYVPNAVARGLANKSTKTIGILSVDIRVPHYATTTYIMEQELSQAGYTVIVCNTGGSATKNHQYIRTLVEKQVDGLLMVGSVFEQVQENRATMDILQNIPVVITNGRLKLPHAYSVMVNDEMGIRMAVDHLAEKGREDIVFIRDLHTESANRKRAGYLEAMKGRGLQDKAFVHATEYGLEGGRKAARELLVSGRPINGVICAEDLTALGFVKELIASGVSVPEAVSVIGFNNSDYALISTPELSTVDNKVETFSSLAVQILRCAIEGKTCASVVVEPELIIRQTSV